MIPLKEKNKRDSSRKNYLKKYDRNNLHHSPFFRKLDKMMYDSKILNIDFNRRPFPTWTKSTLEKYILKLEGDGGIIPNLEKELKQIPLKMSGNLLHKQMILHAQIKVYEDEIIEMKKRLEKWRRAEVKAAKRTNINY